MDKYLPSKKFTKLILIVIGLGLLAWFISYYFSGKTSFERKADKLGKIDSLTESFSEIDSDSDGLKDWEEALWQTNPLSSDSDDDGVDDKKEVEIKRAEISGSSEGEVVSDENETQTSIFAKQFFSTVATINQQGTLDQSDVEKFSDGISQAIENTKIADTYKLSDLKLFNTTAVEYNENLKVAYRLAVTNNTKNSEASVIANFIQTNGSKASEDEMNKVIVTYELFAQNLVTMKVPYTVAGPHLALANASSKIAKSLEILKSINEDPLKSMSGLSGYQENSNNFLNAMKNIAAYLEANAIIN